MAGTDADDLTVDHGVTVKGKWDWTTSTGTSRWTRDQQGVKPRRYFIPTSATEPRNDGFGVMTSRLKIRGKGRAVVIRFDSQQGKDFQLLGWTIPYTSETQD